jgi:hypothetical protein
MTLRTPPPPVHAGARVVAYAYVDDVPYKKWGALYAGNTLIEAVPLGQRIVVPTPQIAMRLLTLITGGALSGRKSSPTRPKNSAWGR